MEIHRTGVAAIPIAAFLPSSRVNGPGLRSVIWVQGCPLRCAGCFNPDFLPFSGGTPTPIAELIDTLLAVTDTEGVTFSGGEPFAHAAALAPIARAVREEGRSVVIFTGYRWADLRQSGDFAHRALLDAADLLLAGPYERDRPSSHPLLSSANQELVFLTDRYRTHDFGPPRRRIDLHIAADGETTITGFPARGAAGLGLARDREERSQDDQKNRHRRAEVPLRHAPVRRHAQHHSQERSG